MGAEHLESMRVEILTDVSAAPARKHSRAHFEESNIPVDKLRVLCMNILPMKPHISKDGYRSIQVIPSATCIARFTRVVFPK
jgi:hypothetical protein